MADIMAEQETSSINKESTTAQAKVYTAGEGMEK